MNSGHLAAIFVCPLCANCFSPHDGQTLVCSAKHTFDVAQQGYVNLIPAQTKTSKNPGYNRALISSRHRFFATGGYDRVAETMADLVLDTVGFARARVLDAGCGEGYYLRALRARDATLDLVGTDLSKPGVKLASRLDATSAFAVANSYHLPLPDASVDVIISHFSPIPLEEFARVLRPGGWLLIGCPGADHLYSLKARVYETPRRHSEHTHDLKDPRFRRAERRVTRYELAIPDQTSLEALYSMTPYAYGSSARSALPSSATASFVTDVHVLFDLYQRAA